MRDKTPGCRARFLLRAAARTRCRPPLSVASARPWPAGGIATRLAVDALHVPDAGGTPKPRRAAGAWRYLRAFLISSIFRSTRAAVTSSVFNASTLTCALSKKCSLPSWSMISASACAAAGLPISLLDA